MSSSNVPGRSTAIAFAVTAALASCVAAAGAAGGSDTAIVVSPRVLTAAPMRSPVEFPGVAAVRAGEPLPKGYVAVARDVRITRGAEAAYAALRMSCPRRQTWRTGAAAGDIDVSVLDRMVGRKRSVLVVARLDPRQTALGETAAGTVYALCR